MKNTVHPLKLFTYCLKLLAVAFLIINLLTIENKRLT